MANKNYTTVYTENEKVKEAIKASAINKHGVYAETPELITIKSINDAFIEPLAEISKAFPAETIEAELTGDADDFSGLYRFEFKNGETKKLKPIELIYCDKSTDKLLTEIFGREKRIVINQIREIVSDYLPRGDWEDFERQRTLNKIAFTFIYNDYKLSVSVKYKRYEPMFKVKIFEKEVTETWVKKIDTLPF